MQNDEVEDTNDCPEFVFVGTNFHTSESRINSMSFTRKETKHTFPRNVTLGFRNNFWRVFSRIEQYDKPDVSFEWLGRKWCFYEFWVATSDDIEFAAYLDNPSNIFVIFVLKPVDQEQYTHIRSLAFNRNISEQQAIGELLASLPDQNIRKFLSTFSHSLGLNALFSWSGNFNSEKIDVAVPLFAFYTFCLLMTWKIGRDQTKISLKIENKHFRRQMVSILKLRSQIINVERYFLTKNISNDDEVKRIAASIKKRFQLEGKMRGFLPMNEAMERHLSTASQLRADDKISTLNLTAFVIAAIGLPISTVSMVLAVGVDSDVIKEGVGLLFRERIWSVLLTIAASTLVTLGALAISIFILKKITK